MLHAASCCVRAHARWPYVEHMQMFSNSQWYYFAVTNMRKSIAYTFNIINLLKDDSLYNRGMRPAMFSVKGMEVS